MKNEAEGTLPGMLDVDGYNKQCNAESTQQWSSHQEYRQHRKYCCCYCCGSGWEKIRTQAPKGRAQLLAKRARHTKHEANRCKIPGMTYATLPTTCQL